MTSGGAINWIGLTGLGGKYYVKEFRVDGRVVPDGDIPLRQGSQLEIVIDDKPATIIGTVTEGGKPFGQPLVFVAKWPTLELSEFSTTGDNDGRFQLTGFAPGEYRVLAVQSTSQPDGQQISPLMLGKFWSSAEKVTLERGESHSVALKLSEPMR
jgi:hypothetical protein